MTDIPKRPGIAYTKDELKVLFNIITSEEESRINKFSKAIGASRSFPAMTEALMPLILNSVEEDIKHLPATQSQGPFADNNSFHKWAKRHHLKSVLRVPLNQLPLYMNKNPFNDHLPIQPRTDHVSALIRWRLQIGK